MVVSTSQKSRLLVLIIYLIVLIMANFIAFGKVMPLNGSDGLWFYSGFASILLGSLLVTPFYSKPVDALSYAVISIIALYSVNDWANWITGIRILYISLLTYSSLVILCSLFTIASKDSISETVRKMADSCRLLSNSLGNQAVLFSLLIFFSVIVFHRNSTRETITILIMWSIIVPLRLEERVHSIIIKIKKIWNRKISVNSIGNIIAYQLPGLVVVRQNQEEKYEYGRYIFLKDEESKVKIGINLGYVGRDQSPLMRCSILDIVIPETDDFKDTPNNCAFTVNSELIDSIIGEVAVASHSDSLVGLVASESNIDTLYFEVLDDSNIAEGKLVEVSIKGERVLYQIVNGYIKEEKVFQKNSYGFARAKAKKIGKWNSYERRFTYTKWIPEINNLVFLKFSEKYKPDYNTIGHFPDSNLTVGIKNINELVTHNTAILGILGVGKSMLAIELIERMINEGIKVVCLDLTNQYSQELSDYYNKVEEDEIIEKIREAGQKDKDNWSDNPDQGGSIPNFINELTNDLQSFIKDGNKQIKIYNPAQLFATKQNSEPKQFKVGNDWHRGAVLTTLTPVEITRIISETLLHLVEDQMTDKARVCLVLEEAHSLVPEFNNVVNDVDRIATNGTARVILQGRKYGLGCLLITQRSANVTKTILNQCNTIFAMRSFDDTSKSFLANFIGSEYVDVLPSIQERHAVFFGKASTSENPVLIRLNDRAQFIETLKERASVT